MYIIIIILGWQAIASGGSWYLDKGGGSNPQCLPADPNYLPSMNGSLRAYMYGAEYETIVGIKNVDDQDVPCAVCHVPRTAVHMVPAKYTCPDGWIRVLWILDG